MHASSWAVTTNSSATWACSVAPGPHLQGRKGRFKAVICFARFKHGADAVDLLDQLARKRNSIHPELR